MTSLLISIAALQPITCSTAALQFSPSETDQETSDPSVGVAVVGWRLKSDSEIITSSSQTWLEYLCSSEESEVPADFQPTETWDLLSNMSESDPASTPRQGNNKKIKPS